MLGQVLGHHPSPLQHQGRGVIHGVEGTGVLPLPAEVTQGAAPAHPLRRPVKDDGGVLLIGFGRPAHAVVQLPQGPRSLCQPLLELLPGGGRVAGLLPLHPLSAEQTPRQEQEQSRSNGCLQHQRLRQRLRGGQQAHQGRRQKRQRRLSPAPRRALPRQQPRKTQARGEYAAACPGAQVRRQAQAQARRGPRQGAPLVGGVEQQNAQQRPSHGDPQHLQVRQCQNQCRRQEQQAIRGGPPLLWPEHRAEEPGGGPRQAGGGQTGRQVPQG